MITPLLLGETQGHFHFRALPQGLVQLPFHHHHPSSIHDRDKGNHHLCLVEEEWRLQLKVELLGDGLDQVSGAQPVQDDEDVKGPAVGRPLADEQRPLDLGALPLLAHVLVHRDLQFPRK